MLNTPLFSGIDTEDARLIKYGPQTVNYPRGEILITSEVVRSCRRWHTYKLGFPTSAAYQIPSGRCYEALRSGGTPDHLNQNLWGWVPSLSSIFIAFYVIPMCSQVWEPQIWIFGDGVPEDSRLGSYLDVQYEEMEETKDYEITWQIYATHKLSSMAKDKIVNGLFQGLKDRHVEN